MQSEAQFTVEALEAKTASLSSHTEEIKTLCSDLDTLRMNDISKAKKLEQLTFAFMASTVAVQHLSSIPSDPLPISPADSVTDLQRNLEISMQCFDNVTEERNNLMSQLERTEKKLTKTGI